jgi:hypothetical protein
MGLIEWIGAILGGIVINLIASELFAWGPRLSDWVTCWAVRQLPPEIQKRMREEWVGHLAALHPLSRTLAAIGFVLAAYRISVSFDRAARGALTLREWLTPKSIVVITMTRKGLQVMKARIISESDKVDTIISKAGNISGFEWLMIILGEDMDSEDVLVRRNLMAWARTTLYCVHQGILCLYGKQLQLPLLNSEPMISRTSSSSDDLMLDGPRERYVLRYRRTIRR